jgi:hypothetical protein
VSEPSKLTELEALAFRALELEIQFEYQAVRILDFRQGTLPRDRIPIPEYIKTRQERQDRITELTERYQSHLQHLAEVRKFDPTRMEIDLDTLIIRDLREDDDIT